MKLQVSSLFRSLSLIASAVALLSRPAFAILPEHALDDVPRPSGYILLDHARTATLGAYINTGLVPDGTVAWELVMRWDATNSLSEHIMGSRIGFQDNAIGFSIQREYEAPKNGLAWHYGSKTYYLGPSPTHSGVDEFFTMAFTANRECQVNDVTVQNGHFGDSVVKPGTFDSATITTTRPIYLFTCNNNGLPHDQKTTSSVRRFRIWKGGSLVRDYVPVKRISDQAVGFYDLAAASDNFVLPVDGMFTPGPTAGGDPVLDFAAAADRGIVWGMANGGGITSGTTLCVEDSVQLTAVAHKGYEFAYWGGPLPAGVSRTNNPAIFAMGTKDLSMTAYFVPTNRTVSAGWTEPTNGVLLITFDDNAVDSWLAATNLFARYAAHASFAVVGSPSGYGSGGSKLLALKSRGHTIGLHTYGHVNTDGYEANPKAYFDAQVKPQIDEYAALGHTCTYMAYPNNKHTGLIDDYIRTNSAIRHFRSGEISTDTASPYWHAAAEGQDLAHNDAVFTPVADLASMTVLNGMGCAAYYNTSIEVVKAGLGRLATNNEVMVLFSHDISASPSNVGMTPTALEAILARAQELGVRVLGADELPYVDDAHKEPEDPEPVTPTADGFAVYEGIYERLESIGIDASTPPFETDYLCMPMTRFRTKVAIDNLPQSTGARSRMGIGRGDNLDACMMGAAYNNGWKFFIAYGNNWAYSYGFEYDTLPHEYDLAPGSQRVDGIEIGTATISTCFPSTPCLQMSPTIWLFRHHNDFDGTDGIIGRFYWAEISEQGTVLHRYLLVLRLADNSVGIYDEVTRTFTEIEADVAINRYGYAYDVSRSVVSAQISCTNGFARTLELQLAPAAANTCSLLYFGYGSTAGGDTPESWEHTAFGAMVLGATNVVSVPWPTGAQFARGFWVKVGAGRLPPNAKFESEISYVGAEGGNTGAYFDTGIKPDATTGYEVTALWLGNSDQFVLGCRETTDASLRYAFAAAVIGQCAAGGYATKLSQLSSYAPTAYHTWSFAASDRQQRIDGVAVNDFSGYSWPSGETSPYSVYLFSINSAGTPHVNRLKGRIKSFKLTKGGELVCDYVPVRVGSTPAFYDCVSDTVVYPVSGSVSGGVDVEPSEVAVATQVFKGRHRRGFALIVY